jgi:hypothetical protein
MYKILAVTVVGILLAGCGDLQQYRYPCQDHKNWDKPECQKPLCEIHRDCPEHIFSNGTSKAVLDYIAGQEAIQIVNNRATKKGECK